MKMGITAEARKQIRLKFKLKLADEVVMPGMVEEIVEILSRQIYQHWCKAKEELEEMERENGSKNRE